MAYHESEYKYLESWSMELTSRADRVRQLIGDRHWLTDGHHKEVIVREFLSRHLSSGYEIGSGFIKSAKGDQCSTEIDILISDWSRHPAFFNEGGIQIVPPSSVMAYIEMKSTFGASSLSSALAAVTKTQVVLDTCVSHVWRSICFVSIDRDLDSFIESLANGLESHIHSDEFPNSRAIGELLPKCITSFSSYLAFLRISEDERSVVINAFDFGSLSAAVAFSDLFGHLISHSAGNHGAELEEMIGRLPKNNYVKKVVKLYE